MNAFRFSHAGASLALVAFAQLYSASHAVAGIEAYECEVKGEYWLQDSGRFVEQPRSKMIGERFMVERDSGRIVGLILSNGQADRISLVNRGNAENGFTAFWFKEAVVGGRLAGSLHVQEFVAGPQKPFVYWSWPGYLTGTCR